ncbi:SOUL heme-binding protein-domain-containing protein [Zopfochytrium polystomum]|nr:SOUL heme-binding protein-domain-containing protein [Zopfochytrium polystomum]
MASLLGFILEEQPKFNLITSANGYEIREYQPYIQAETTFVPRTNDGGGGFWPIAQYIFGKNKIADADESAKIAMTAPVLMERPAETSTKIAMTTPVLMDRPAESSTKIAMTAPVLMEKVDGGASDNGAPVERMAFVMPSKYKTIADLPVPVDPSIKLRDIPAHTVAVRKFAGTFGGGQRERWASALEEEKKLREACAKDGVRLEEDRSKTKVAAYNPPWTPWFLQTNEVHVNVLS